MTASAHPSSDPTSRHLCDLVLQATLAKIPDISRRETKTWCTFGQPDCSKGFFVRHCSRSVTIWPRWNFTEAEELQKAAVAAGLEATIRRNVEDSWAKRYPVQLKVGRDADVHSVLPLLLHAVSSAAGTDSKAYRGLRFAQEVSTQLAFTEGATRSIVVNAYERNPAARLACISHYGASCLVCGLDFGERYGDIGEGFIHVHHLIPLSSLRKERTIDPKQDLRPVCPNCHEMLHRREPPYSIEELKQIMKDQSHVSGCSTSSA